ncbi:hypothetical protein Celal_0589 [Cellulophaga algicola DSM 14237]|uniref:Uncharacterized protein n=1 Tax=Cellulophaga algicola (strain DSM 14237 / IC166 / ACAM 630) TaxID=688270 RepID=E6XCF3_CELAD|nr:hypothetical protein [Cellulophaga algicola]ADV47928.1 hypothetical protein Celal_0589 [Cellulophaga algicola DSM 14237]
MIDFQKVFAQIDSPSIRKIATSLASFFNDLVQSFCNDKDGSGKKVQYLAQRVDGKKVPVNRKL